MYILGMDIGTTGTKAILADQNGRIISSAYRVYELIKGSGGEAEQRAEDWWEALIETARQCTGAIDDKNEVAAIALSSQGGSLVLTDQSGQPLCNALVWMDHRSLAEHDELVGEHGSDCYYEKTGWKLNPGLNLCKIRWIRKNRPELFNKASKFLTTVDYVQFKLTGEYVVDPSNAAMTQLYNVRKGEWDSELLALAGLDKSRLPVIKPSTSYIGRLTRNAADTLGLPETVKVICGGHDQYCAAAGCGALTAGKLLISTGTAWAVMGITKNPLFDTHSYMSPGPHLADGLWGALATVPTAGVCMEWFRDQFGNAESFQEIDAKAKERCSDLYFYPYFSGSGAPDHEVKAKATFAGLELGHDKYDLARAIMEGVGFQTGVIIERLSGCGQKYSDVLVMGGAAKSGLWMDILANTLPQNLWKIRQSDAACVGAAISAGVGIGMFSDYTNGYKAFSQGETIVEKSETKRDYYATKYAKYVKNMDNIWRIYE